VVASAIVNSLNKSLEGNYLISVSTLGGNLSVALDKHDNRFSDVWLNGPAAFVFKGEVVVQ
jgi:diaminopimelate epimerase